MIRFDKRQTICDSDCVQVSAIQHNSFAPSAGRMFRHLPPRVSLEHRETGGIGSAMTKREIYEKYLQSSHWRSLKDAKLKATPNCESCDSEIRPTVHHLNYKNLYDVVQDDLMTLCVQHHDLIHIILPMSWFGRTKNAKAKRLKTLKLLGTSGAMMMKSEREIKYNGLAKQMRCACCSTNKPNKVVFPRAEMENLQLCKRCYLAIKWWNERYHYHPTQV